MNGTMAESLPLPACTRFSLPPQVEKSSILTLIPYVAMTAMMPFVGPTADSLVEKGMKLTWVRKLCQGEAFWNVCVRVCVCV